MINTALQQPTLAQEVQNVSAALNELSLSTRKLIIALWAALTQRRQPGPIQTARKQADKLRAYADTFHRVDRSYAQDLYAAATRHEMAARAE